MPQTHHPDGVKELAGTDPDLGLEERQFLELGDYGPEDRPAVPQQRCASDPPVPVPSLGNPDIAITNYGLEKGMGEAGRWEHRFEAFNLFSATRLGNRNNAITDEAKFARITHSGEGPRILRRSLKYSY